MSNPEFADRTNDLESISAESGVAASAIAGTESPEADFVDAKEKVEETDKQIAASIVAMLDQPDENWKEIFSNMTKIRHPDVFNILIPLVENKLQHAGETVYNDELVLDVIDMLLAKGNFEAAAQMANEYPFGAYEAYDLKQAINARQYEDIRQPLNREKFRDPNAVHYDDEGNGYGDDEF